MNSQPVNILIIEDDPGDLCLIRENLTDLEDLSVEISAAKSLSQGFSVLEKISGNEQVLDLVLLDLNLNDSQGLKTLEKVASLANTVPIIVLTGVDEKILGIQAIKAGAQDYLVKGETDPPILGRAIRYAIERCQLTQALEQARFEHQERMEKEELSKQISNRITGTNDFESGEMVDLLFADYRALVYKTIRSRRLGKERPSKEAVDMACQMASMGVLARDIVQLHLKVIDGFSQKGTPRQNRSFSNDARLVLLEILGRVMDNYRGMAFGTAQRLS